jgi:hypothetical protein
MLLFSYVGGMKWGFYEDSNKIGEIEACKFASFGLEVVFVTDQPMHILVFETLTGKLKKGYRNT